MNTADTRMFFVLGRGRSGSDLLVRILNTHQQLSVAPEALFLINLYRKYANVKNWNEQKILSFFHDLLLENRLTDWWQLDKKQLKHDLLKLSGEATFQTLCKTVYLNFAQQTGKENVKLLGDKNPTYTLFAKELLQIYPEAKFIHLVRDPRDNILSFKRVSFDLTNGGFYCAACQPVATQGLLLSHETLNALRTLQTSPVEEMNGQLESWSSQQQIDGFLNAYLKYHVEGIRDLNSLKVLRKIKSKLGNLS